MRGKFIVFDGNDGAGKSTQIELVEKALKERGIDVICTREPGGTPLAEDLRAMMLGTDTEPMDAVTETLLAFAARRQHIERVIRPALEEGRWVLCDRYVMSTYAYQGGGGGVPLNIIDDLADWVQSPGLLRGKESALWPDMTILFSVDQVVAQSRVSNRQAERDRMELQESSFNERVRKTYERLPHRLPCSFSVINANVSAEKVFEQVWNSLGYFLDEPSSGLNPG